MKSASDNFVGRKPKLTPEDVSRARQWAAVGRSMKSAAKYFGVSPRVLRAYLDGEHKRRYSP